MTEQPSCDMCSGTITDETCVIVGNVRHNGFKTENDTVAPRSPRFTGDTEVYHEVCWNRSAGGRDTDRIPPEDVHQRLYQIIKAQGPIMPGDLYEQYQATVENPRSDRALREYVGRLRENGYVRKDGQRKGKRFKVADDSTYTVDLDDEEN